MGLVLFKMRAALTTNLYFHTTGTLPMSLYCILQFWGKPEGNLPAEISPGIQPRKEAEISTYKIPLHFPRISAGKLSWNYHRDDPLQFPHKSAWKFWGRGWLARWDVGKHTSKIYCTVLYCKKYGYLPYKLSSLLRLDCRFQHLSTAVTGLIPQLKQLVHLS